MGTRKLHILRRQGCVPKHFDLRAGITTIVVYAHDIESPLAHRWSMPQIFPHDLCQFAPLVPVHRRFWSLHVERCASLNFQKTQYIAVPPNHVNLASVPRRPVVARNDHIAQPPHVEVRIVLALRSHPQMTRHLPLWHHSISTPVKRSHHNLRKSSGKHGGDPNVQIANSRGCDVAHKKANQRDISSDLGTIL